MTVSAGEVRAALGAVSKGGSLAGGPPAVWTTLVERGALEGTPDSPTLTPVGQHVLAELEVRAYRADAMSIDEVAQHLTRVLNDLDTVAKTAEYFLAELGPVTPPEALPFLRPVAVGLANRRDPPEEIAAVFRNVWGSVEVMGGDPRDRLLAAELLTAQSASLESLYAPLMTSTTWIRESLGEREPAVAPAALLHLHPGADGKPAQESFLALRKAGVPPEEAALLAGLPDTPAALVNRRELVSRALGTKGPQDAAAATFLMVLGVDLAQNAGRIREISSRLEGSLPAPLGAAVLLNELDWLQPAELADWAAKAIEVARRRQLAPTDPELGALGVALVHGLPPTEFGSHPRPPDEAREVSAAVLAIHRWIYRPLLAGTPVAG